MVSMLAALLLAGAGGVASERNVGIQNLATDAAIQSTGLQLVAVASPLSPLLVNPDDGTPADTTNDDTTNDDTTTASPTTPRRSPSRHYPLSEAYFAHTGRRELGLASWYGPGFDGRRSADGHRFDMNGMTAAHKTLPLGTVVRVTNQRTGQSCLVRITDRGPYVAGRIIDLSRAAAKSIGMLGSGVARVKIEVLYPRGAETAERPHHVSADDV